MITALDVAIAAGVSKTTVSYVFSPDKASLISEKTRLKVLSTADKLGYQPCFLGRSLSAKRSYNVALVLPSRCGQSMSAHLLEIFHGIVQSSEGSEYNLSIFLGGGKRLDASLQSRRIDGVIAVGLSSDNTLLEHIAGFKLPLVVVNKYFPSGKLTGCVRADIAGWMKSEVAALKNNGCRNILILNKPSMLDAGREIAASADALLREQNNSTRLDIAVMNEDLPRQMQLILQSTPAYDGFIINGSEGLTLQQQAALLNIPQDKLKISHFSASNHLPGDNCRAWNRCGYIMGQQSWELLLKMLTQKSDGCEILQPLLPSEESLRKESNPEFGLDL